MTGQEFTVVAAVLAVAAVAGLLANRLRQPLIVAFIGVGILVGPVGFGWVTDVGDPNCWPNSASRSCSSWSACGSTCT